MKISQRVSELLSGHEFVTDRFVDRLTHGDKNMSAPGRILDSENPFPAFCAYSKRTVSACGYSKFVLKLVEYMNRTRGSGREGRGGCPPLPAPGKIWTPTSHFLQLSTLKVHFISFWILNFVLKVN